MAATSAFALWETIKGISHMLGGGTPEAPLVQQTADAVIPSFADEAIQAALDAALYEISSDHLERIRKVRDSLEPHQQTRWRKAIGTLELTEKFETFTVSEKTTTSGDKNNQDQQQGQAVKDQRKRNEKGARKETTRTFDRRKRDYEYTKEDPRVQHLILVSNLVGSVPDEAAGIAKAKAYLFSAGMIVEKSLQSQVTEKVSQAKEAALDTVYHGAISIALGDKYDRICKLTHGARRDKLLSRAIELKSDAKKRELEALRAERFPQKRIYIAAAGISIAAIAIAIAALN